MRTAIGADDLTRRRLFSKKQREAIWLAAGGLCESCGLPIDQSFHADHVVPYGSGGATDVLNGQALCPQCNLEKGDKDVKQS